jgi:nucleoside-diphosphate-sugar epimerase
MTKSRQDTFQIDHEKMHLIGSDPHVLARLMLKGETTGFLNSLAQLFLASKSNPAIVLNPGKLIGRMVVGPLLRHSPVSMSSLNGAKGKIAVVGATGKVGRLAVQELLKQGYIARVLWRRDADSALVEEGATAPTADADVDEVRKWYASNPSGVEKVQGDVTNPESLDALLCGCSAVLALHGARRTTQLSDLWSDPTLDPQHSKNVNYEGVRNLIAAARASDTCKRIVRLTGKGETPWSIFSILINGLGSMAKAWNYEGENLLRACEDLEYTIVRPGVMTGDESEFPKASLALGDNGADLKVTSIPHSMIARLCVESLEYPNAGRSTLCAMASAEPGMGGDDWKPLLQDVAADRRRFREDLLAEHFKAVRVGGTGIAAVALGIVLAGLRGIVLALANFLH